METERRQIPFTANKRKPDPATEGHELLTYYLSLSERERHAEFPTTADAARLVGLSQRTIQLWVEIGTVKAVAVGRKRFVRMDSLVNYIRLRSEEGR